MVARQCAELAGQLGTALIAQLLGMQLDGQTQSLGRLKHPARLRRRETDALAKGIHRIDQALFLQLRKPVADGADVLLLAPQQTRPAPRARLRRWFVRPRSARRPGALATPQAGCLGGQIEAVAGLDLDRGHTFSLNSWRKRAAAVSNKACSLALARGRDAGAYAATGTGNLFVASTFEAQLKLIGAQAPVDQMGVAIYEPGCHQGTVQIMGLSDATEQLFGHRIGRPPPTPTCSPSVMKEPSAMPPQG